MSRWILLPLLMLLLFAGTNHIPEAARTHARALDVALDALVDAYSFGARRKLDRPRRPHAPPRSRVILHVPAAPPRSSCARNSARRAHFQQFLAAPKILVEIRPALPR